MTFLEYLDFLEDYWEIFGPPPKKQHIEYTNVKL